MSATAHSLLSASSSARWLHCTPSARLSQSFENRTSSYAEEGTKAHAGAEKWLNMTFHKSKDTMKDLMAYFKEADFPADMIDYVSGYNDYVKGIYDIYDDASAYVELTVDLSNYIPSGFGTVDCAIQSTSSNTLYIIDFKYGKGVKVEAHANTQMAIYALGVLDKLKIKKDDVDIHCIIYQPRIRNISEWQTTSGHLFNWATKTLAPLAQRAWEGKGQICAGSWCRFCPVKPRCRAYSEFILSTPHEVPAEFTAIANTLSDDELSDILDKSKELASYITAIEDELKKVIKEKGAVKGYTLQEVKGRRVLNDECVEVLKRMGVEPYEQKLKAISTLEKEYSKNFIDPLLDGIVTYSKPTYRLTKVKDVFK